MSSTNFPVSIATNESFVNWYLSGYYNANPDTFSGSGTIDALDMDYSYSVSATPTVAFAPLSSPDPDDPAAQAVVKFSAINLTTYAVNDGKRGKELGSWTFQADIYASTEVSNLKISFKTLNVQLSGLGSMNKTAQYIANHVLVPELLQKLQGLPLPLLGPDDIGMKDVDAQITNVFIQDHIVTTYSDLTYKGHASSPTDTNPPALLSTPSYAAILAAIRSDGVNTLAQAQCPPLSYQEKKSINIGINLAVWKLKSADLTVSGSATIPVINIESGNPTFSTTISAKASVTVYYSHRNLKLQWVNGHTTLHANTPDVPLNSIPITIQKNSAGDEIQVTEIIPTFKFNFGSDWSFPWNEAAKLIDNALNGMANEVRDYINSKIPTYTIFKLNDDGYSMPHTDLTAKFEFAELKANGNSISTILKLTNQ